MKKKLFLLAAIVASLFMTRHLLSVSEESTFAKLVDANVAALANAQRLEMDGPPVVITCDEQSPGNCWGLDIKYKRESLEVRSISCNRWTGRMADYCNLREMDSNLLMMYYGIER